jgi:hypothetical protein
MARLVEIGPRFSSTIVRYLATAYEVGAMLELFISYNRRDEDRVRGLISDLEQLGDRIWFDRELSGGQRWWDQILDRIRTCDALVFAMTQHSVTSEACRREIEYAIALAKPVLPIQLIERIPIHLVPQSIAALQFVEWGVSREGAFRLGRALRQLPRAAPLPNPLPAPPPMPISYLGTLRERVESSAEMTFEEQSGLLVRLVDSLREPASLSDAVMVLRRFRKRPDLFASIAAQIDQHVKSRPFPPGAWAKSIGDVESSASTRAAATHAPKLQRALTSPVLRKRLVVSIAAGVLGLLLGAVAWKLWAEGQDTSRTPLYGWLQSALGAACAGAIVGTSLVRSAVCVAFGLLGWLSTAHYFDFAQSYAWYYGVIIFAPRGYVLGAVVARIGEWFWRLRVARRNPLSSGAQTRSTVKSLLRDV